MMNGHIISFDLFDRKLYLNSKNGDISFHVDDVMNQYEIDYKGNIKDALVIKLDGEK